MTYKLLLFATRIPGLLTVESDQDTEESRLRRLYLRWCSERGGEGFTGRLDRVKIALLNRCIANKLVDIWMIKTADQSSLSISRLHSVAFSVFFFIWACKAVAYRLGNTVLRPFVLLIVF